MYLQSLACAVPAYRFSQDDLWPLYCSLPIHEALRPGSNELIRKTLTRDNGIGHRHFALGDLAALTAMDAQELNEAYEREAPTLAAAALERAMEGAGLSPDALDGLVVCTCTGYLCPGVSSYVAERLGLRADCFLQDIVGMGCGAAIPSLRAAAGQLAVHPQSRVAVIAVELCSAAFFLEDRGDVIISACLFGDGAAAAVLSGADLAATGWRVSDFDTVHQPENRECLRFQNDRGKLKNRLERTVPERAGEAVLELWKRFVERRGGDVEILPHAGGKQILESLAARLPQTEFPESAWALHHGGNMSSPSCLFALGAYLFHHDTSLPVVLPTEWGVPPKRSPQSPDALWLTSFGAGFSAHACSLRRD